MERKTHIERMKMIGAILDGKNLPEAAHKVAVDYAGELASNAELRGKVRAFTQSKSLAERDIKRAVQLAGRTKPVQSVTTPTPEVPRPKRPTLAKPDQFTKFVSVEEAKHAYEQWVAWYGELDPFSPDLTRLRREYDAKEYERKAA